MSVKQSLFRFVLVICYFIIFVCEQFKIFFHKFQHRITYRKLNATHCLWKCPDVLKTLRHELTLVPKRPKHIALVLRGELSPLCNYAQFVIWCVLADVHYVTFYDIAGTLQQRSEEFSASLKQMKGYMLGDAYSPSIRIHLPNDAERNECNGEKDTIHVCVTSYCDGGAGAVLRAARELCAQKEPITVNDITLRLNVMRDWPEPDVLIRTGGIHSHDAYLPWHLKLTEFIDIETEGEMMLSEFVDVLKRFNRIEQRCGR